MRDRVAAALAFVLALVDASLPAIAQQSAEPAPILRTTIDPPRVVVGQKATLRVEVLAPNYMTSPPVLPEFQVRNAVTRSLQAVNLNEQQSGVSYAGVRYEFAIYPQEPGSYAVAGQTVTLKYAAVPPQTREATLPVPLIAFEAVIPDAAAQLVPFIAATRLTIEQGVQRSSDELKVGGSITRTVTIKAEGTPAMLLPPTPFPPVDGMAVYPAQPVLDDHTDGRTDVLTASRVDAATYMLEKPGDYLLPAATVRWWNVGTGKIETARLDSVSLHVIDDPAAPRAAPEEAPRTVRRWDAIVDGIASHWRLTLVALAAMAALAWLLPRAARALNDWYRRRRDTYLASESWAFTRLTRTARHHDASRTYAALVHWLERFDPIAPRHTLAALKTAANDSELDRQIGAVEMALFGPSGGSAQWSARALLRKLRATRRRLLRRTSSAIEPRPLPQELNPVAAHAPATTRHRPVAR